jgi:hypothetical protein
MDGIGNPLTSSSSLKKTLFLDDFGDYKPLLTEMTYERQEITNANLPHQDINQLKYTEQEILGLKQESFLAGVDSGLTQSSSRNAVDVLKALDRIASALEDDSLTRRKQVQVAIEAIGRLIINSLVAILPSLCDRNAVSGIVDSVKLIFSGVNEESAVTVEVSSSLEGDIRSALGALPPALTRRIALAPSECLPTGEARMKWELGIATHSPERIRMGVISLLTEMNLMTVVARDHSSIMGRGEIQLHSNTYEKGERINV